MWTVASVVPDSAHLLPVLASSHSPYLVLKTMVCCVVADLIDLTGVSISFIYILSSLHSHSLWELRFLWFFHNEPEAQSLFLRYFQIVE